MNDRITLSQASALAAIIGAAERNTPVARKHPSTGAIIYAEARYVGGHPGQLRDWIAGPLARAARDSRTGPSPTDAGRRVRIADNGTIHLPATGN